MIKEPENYLDDFKFSQSNVNTYHIEKKPGNRIIIVGLKHEALKTK